MFQDWPFATGGNKSCQEPASLNLNIGRLGEAGTLKRTNESIVNRAHKRVRHLPVLT